MFAKSYLLPKGKIFETVWHFFAEQKLSHPAQFILAEIARAVLQNVTAANVLQVKQLF
jgi:hypothetical protein